MPFAKDEADIASEQEQYAREEALFRFKRSTEVKPTGVCRFCDEPCTGLFCDLGCRQDWEKERKVRLAQTGKAEQRHKEGKAK